MDELTERIQNVSQQNELLRVEHWSRNVVKQFCALNSNPNRCDFVLLLPEPNELIVDPLKLLCELFGAVTWTCGACLLSIFEV